MLSFSGNHIINLAIAKKDNSLPELPPPTQPSPPTVLSLMNASDLHPLTPGNSYIKYADDIFLVVPSSNTASIP